MNDYILKKDATTLLVASSAASAIISFGLALVVAPMPETKQHCTLYKVDKRSETSFVMKPPELVCPQTQKCEPTTISPEPTNVDSQKSTKETVDDDPKPRHRRWRKHRIRRYWR